MPSQSAGTAGIESAAANLRTDLNYLLGEHLILASKATGAALDGRSDQFAAYGALLGDLSPAHVATLLAAFGQHAAA